MKITLISPHATVLDQEGRAANADLNRLAGIRLSEETIDRYLDAELADLGLTGGIIYVVNRDPSHVDIAVDYWSPERLGDRELDLLIQFTTGQLADGIGENGFEVTVGEQTLLISNRQEPLIAEQTDDHRTVPSASRVARAARDGKMHALRVALASGEDIDARLQGYTGLQLAILYARRDGVEALINAGANVNAKDDDGNTPLHLCALSNRLSDAESSDIARKLLRKGADPGICNQLGETALALARIRGKAATAAELVDASGR